MEKSNTALRKELADAKAAQEASESLGGYMSSDTKVPTGDVVLKDFVIYAEKDTLGYNYGQANDIKVVSGTVQIGSKNVVKGFIAAVIGAVCAAVIGLIGIMTGKSLKKKKEEKERAERRKASAEKAAAPESEDKTDEE